MTTPDKYVAAAFKRESISPTALLSVTSDDKLGMSATAQEGTDLNTVTSKCGEPTPIAGTTGDSRERPAKFPPDSKAFEKRIITGLREIKKRTATLPNVE